MATYIKTLQNKNGDNILPRTKSIAVSINDTGEYFAGTNIEDVTQEIGAILKDKQYAYVYRGSITTYELLPTENLQNGDVYNVETLGKNYAWNGNVWDDIGGMLALATTEIDGLMSKENYVRLGELSVNSLKAVDENLINNVLANSSFILGGDFSDGVIATEIFTGGDF